MLHRPGCVTEARVNRARHAADGAIREARELWELGYTVDDRWVCVDDNCRVRMVPCAWQRPNEQGQFCKENGEPQRQTTHFRAEPAHLPGCCASTLEWPARPSLAGVSHRPPGELPKPRHPFSGSRAHCVCRQRRTGRRQATAAEWSRKKARTFGPRNQGSLRVLWRPPGTTLAFAEGR